MPFVIDDPLIIQIVSEDNPWEADHIGVWGHIRSVSLPTLLDCVSSAPYISASELRHVKAYVSKYDPI